MSDHFFVVTGGPGAAKADRYNARVFLAPY